MEKSGSCIWLLASDLTGEKEQLEILTLDDVEVEVGSPEPLAAVHAPKQRIDLGITSTARAEEGVMLAEVAHAGQSVRTSR